MIWFEELQTERKFLEFLTVTKTFPENERRDKEQFLDLKKKRKLMFLKFEKR
jgi:hypothetical protein